MSEKAAERLHVIARAPFEVYYEGDALALTAVNQVGQFDVLPGHADFFSMLLPCEVVVETGTDAPVKFHITSGIVTVRDNQVMLFANM